MIALTTVPPPKTISPAYATTAWPGAMPRSGESKMSSKAFAAFSAIAFAPADDSVVPHVALRRRAG